MLQVLLKTLKDADGTYPFPDGTLRVVDLTCDDVLNQIEDVIVDSSLNTYDLLAPGRITAIKITSACDTSVYWIALGNKTDLQTLQICCFSARNYPISIGCNSIGAKEVFNVMGTSLGVVNTPAQFVALWNSDPINQIIGTLYLKSDLYAFSSTTTSYSSWTFILQHKTGNYLPLNLQCTTEIPPPIVNVYWDYFAIEPINLNALSFSHSQPYVAGQSIQVPIDDMPYNTWFVLKYPLTEPNFLHWQNSDFQGIGDIPDFVFLTNIMGIDGKFLKTRNASSFQTEINLTFTH